MLILFKSIKLNINRFIGCKRTPAGFFAASIFIESAAILLVILPLIISPGCKKKNESQKLHGAGQSAQADKNKHSGEHKPSRPPVPVAVAPAAAGSISSYYKATTALEAEKEAQILARASGVVKKLDCEEGDIVREGKKLLYIEDTEYKLRLAEAQAKTLTLQDKFDRMRNMWKKSLVSEEEFNSARNELKGAKATEEIARLNLSYTVVTAPFDGHIVGRMVDIGQNISAGAPLFTISDFNPLLARVYVPSKEFKKLMPDQPVELILDSTKNKLQGMIKLISPIIDPASGTIKITVQIMSYPAGTRPGDFAEINIVTEKRLGTVLVPKSAVFTERGERIAFIAVESAAERRIVEVGFEDDLNAEILSGIAQGELVVIKGQHSLKHGDHLKILNYSQKHGKMSQRDGDR